MSNPGSEVFVTAVKKEKISEVVTPVSGVAYRFDPSKMLHKVAHHRF